MTKAVPTYHIGTRIIDGLRIRMQRAKERKNLSAHISSLQEIVARRPNKDVIVFPPGLGWYAHLFQRPQHLASALAQLGLLVFYIEPELSSDVIGFHRLNKNLFICRIPVETFSALDKPFVYTLTWNRKYLSAFCNPRIIYDHLDDLEAFDGSPARLNRSHEWLLDNAAVVLVTAQRLLRRVQENRPDALFCPNGVDYPHFSRFRDNLDATPPQDLKQILRRGQPIIGYHGALARWFDYDLLKNIASGRVDLSFVLIGPDYDGTLPADLVALSNVDWLGVKSYDELPQYLRWFDVAMIPFLLNNITHATSPLKLFECMAAGKPIVVTPMQESTRYDGVLVGGYPEDFSQKIDQALRLRDDAEYMRLIDQIAKQNSWNTRGQQILDALYN